MCNTLWISTYYKTYQTEIKQTDLINYSEYVKDNQVNAYFTGSNGGKQYVIEFNEAVSHGKGNSF